MINNPALLDLSRPTTLSLARLQDSSTFDTNDVTVGYSNSYVELFEPSKALAWLELYGPDYQRNVRQNHVKFLANEIRKGRFQMCAIKIAVLPDGTRILNDGQHRLWAIAESGENVSLAVIETSFDTMEEAYAAYADTDNGMVRTTFDALTPHLASRIPSYSFNGLNAGVSQIITGFQDINHAAPALKSRSTRLEAIERYAPYWQQYFGLWNTNTAIGRALKRAPVASIALVTFENQNEKANAFWSRISHNEGMSSGDPGHTLVNWLLSNPAKNYSAGLYSRYVAQAWNAYYEGRTLSRLNLGRITNSIRIEGTPFTGQDPLSWGEF